MHGRARVVVTEDAAAASARKAAALRRVTNVALAGRGALVAGGDKAADKLCSEVLVANADVYSLWSARRQRLSAFFSASEASLTALSSSIDGANDVIDAKAATTAANEATVAELHVSVAALARSPKSYAAWHHRAWTVAMRPCAIDWSAELDLCSRLLTADERNFHCWSYRRWLVAAARVTGAATGPTSGESDSSVDNSSLSVGELAPPSPFSTASELAFTLDRIRRNFSNYSAWHGRSVLLREQAAAKTEKAVTLSLADAATTMLTVSALCDAGAAGAAINSAAVHSTSATHQQVLFGADVVPDAVPSVATLTAELALIQRALFTEPDDQSPWMYHRWLVDRLAEAAQAAPAASSATQLLLSPAADAASAGAAGASALAADAAADAAASALLSDVASLCALRAAEPASKWPHIGIAHALLAAARSPALLSSLVTLAQTSVTASAHAGDSIVTGMADSGTSEALALLAPASGAGPVVAACAAYAAAAELDPSRAACYKHLARAALVAQGAK